MTRSHARESKTLVAIVVLASVTAVSAPREDAGDVIRRAKKDAEAGRYVAADSGFALAASMAEGEERAEALFLRASVVRSGNDAESLYRRIVDDFVETEWAEPAAMELAKIQFAMGRYEGAREVIAANTLCARNDQACLFDGMAAIMLRRYDEANVSLASIGRGSERTWAMIALAETEEGLGHHDLACNAYASLARARAHPTAWLRHAECLETAGDAEGARREYEALADAFPYSPEALRAAAKLNPPPATQAATPATPGTTPAADEEKPALGGTGFTLQFGSFADRGNAIRLASQIKKTHPAVRIDSELVNYREVFRVRYGQFATREEAQAAGEAMAREVEERYTVMPVTRAANE